MHDTITSIGAHAFEGNSNMTVVRLPNNLATVGADAFKGCTAVTTLTCPTSFDATTMGIVFTKLTSLTMTAGTGSSTNYTSSNYTSLPWSGSSNGFTLTFNSGVREIGSYAFYSANIKSITHQMCGSRERHLRFGTADPRRKGIPELRCRRYRHVPRFAYIDRSVCLRYGTPS